MYPYDYVAGGPIFGVRLIGATPSRCHYEVSFSTPFRADSEEGSTAYGDFFVPQNTKAPLLIISHGYGDKSMAPCLTLARLLVRNGIAAFVLYLPIHSRRLPAAMRGEFPLSDSRAWFEYTRRAVIEIRRVVDWAYTRDDIDHSKVGVTGISFGGMISAIAMAVDTRIFEGIFVAIGGNCEELAWGGKGGVYPVGHACTRAECHAVYSQYSKYMGEVAAKGLENASRQKSVF